MWREGASVNLHYWWKQIGKLFQRVENGCCWQLQSVKDSFVSQGKSRKAVTSAVRFSTSLSLHNVNTRVWLTEHVSLVCFIKKRSVKFNSWYPLKPEPAIGPFLYLHTCGVTIQPFLVFSGLFQTINLTLASKPRQIVWDMTQQRSAIILSSAEIRMFQMKKLLCYSPLKPVMEFQAFLGRIFRWRACHRQIWAAADAVCVTFLLHLRFLRSWSEWRSCARNGPWPGASWTMAASEWCRHMPIRCSASVLSYERNDYMMSV